MISCRRESLLVEELLVLTVLSEGAREGTPLKVEKRLDVRFDVTCSKTVSVSAPTVLSEGHLLGDIQSIDRQAVRKTCRVDEAGSDLRWVP